VTRLLEESNRDLKTIVQRLAEEERIAPLATSGIVGQVTPTFVVYDAETTHGGSGGPVMDRNGRVVAINAAILNDFGGSNLGVPVEWARHLLEHVHEDRAP
jgi:S1-C subfamily serine protease